MRELSIPEINQVNGGLPTEVLMGGIAMVSVAGVMVAPAVYALGMAAYQAPVVASGIVAGITLVSQFADSSTTLGLGSLTLCAFLIWSGVPVYGVCH